MKHLAAMALFSVIAACTPLLAQTVEVALFESAVDGAQLPSRSSELVISGALDALFDAGFIGTNSRPRPGDAESFLSYKPGLPEVEGRIDFVIVILAEYDQKALVPACGYRLVRVADALELSGGRIPAIVPASTLRDEVDKACAAVGKAVSAECGRVMRRVGSARRNYEHEKV